MKRANRSMLIAGVLLAAVAFVAVISFGNMGKQAGPAPADVSVVVAAVDLSLGTQLTADALTTQNRPQADASGTYQHPEELVGRIVRRAVPTGQVLTADDFDTTTVNQNVAQSLQAGLRAIALPLSNVDSVGALLQPGDRVDVIISLRDIDGLNPIVVNNPNAGQTTVDGTVPDPYILIDDYVNNTSVKVVVQNVQVLAVTPKPIEDSTAAAPSGTPAPDVVVVLEVTPQQSEVVRFAQLDGNISLVLRAPGDGTAADTITTGVTLKELVDRWGVLKPQPVTP